MVLPALTCVYTEIFSPRARLINAHHISTRQAGNLTFFHNDTWNFRFPRVAAVTAASGCVLRTPHEPVDHGIWWLMRPPGVSAPMWGSGNDDSDPPGPLCPRRKKEQVWQHALSGHLLELRPWPWGFSSAWVDGANKVLLIPSVPSQVNLPPAPPPSPIFQAHGSYPTFAQPSVFPKTHPLLLEPRFSPDAGKLTAEHLVDKPWRLSRIHFANLTSYRHLTHVSTA